MQIDLRIHPKTKNVIPTKNAIHIHIHIHKKNGENARTHTLLQQENVDWAYLVYYI